MRPPSLLFLPLVLLHASLPAVEMTLMDSEGREIQADVQEIRGLNVRFSLEGKQFELPINQLDPSTQQELAQLRESLVPAVEMRLRVEATAEKVRTDELVRRPRKPLPGEEEADDNGDNRREPPAPSVRIVDFWAYRVTLINTANVPTSNAVVDYRVYAGEALEESRVVAGKAELEPIPAFGRWSGHTPGIRVDEDEKMFGAAVRILAPGSEAVLFEWKAPALGKVNVDWEAEVESDSGDRPPRPPL